MSSFHIGCPCFLLLLLPPLPACICLESACFCLYILKAYTTFVLHTRRDEHMCVPARRHVKALDGRYYDECCLAQWCPGWVSPGHVSGKGHCMIHSRCLAHTPSDDGSESERRERIRDGGWGGGGGDVMMDQTQTHRENDSEVILKQKKRTTDHLPIQYIILPPSPSIPKHTTGTHRHLKREVLMSSMEMLTFR